ncbi:hypothetical protein NEPAR06_0230 [Nematocida parisii]|uniref:uncharacterized protein n=1 Tax=Nematocida parisii (strain ERTm1 / ATCC PRA-289) TaxID=881290 RepID=UPI000264B829|nr:uncharacterized protein NEPG_00631 [Nematocida parisii ERTm1]EIJ95106.1 hypothetical protein NEPG_00631 [Nematocida parisii ERTm1]KAI5153152.1 hypothetical protein NEPAR06_0230 [Nematocida parisii]|eukprot:XP_013058462.1 hypothetical protein NEPG_00631 [Nematocida parisii ERTm1]
MKKKNVRVLIVLCMLSCLVGIGVLMVTSQNIREVKNKSSKESLSAKPAIEEDCKVKHEISFENILDKTKATALDKEEIAPMANDTSLNTDNSLDVDKKLQEITEEKIISSSLNTEAALNIKKEEEKVSNAENNLINVSSGVDAALDPETKTLDVEGGLNTNLMDTGNQLDTKRKSFEIPEDIMLSTTLYAQDSPNIEMQIITSDCMVLTSLNTDNPLDTKDEFFSNLSAAANSFKKEDRLRIHPTNKNPLYIKKLLATIEEENRSSAESEIPLEMESDKNFICKECSLSEMDITQEVVEMPDIGDMDKQNSKIERPQEIASVFVYSPQEELIEMLECIARQNPSLSTQLEKYNDEHTINALLKNRNAIVIRQIAFSNLMTVEEITLWKVLKTCKKGLPRNSACSESTILISLLYPPDMMYNPFVVHAMLTYYNPNTLSNVFLSLLQFDFQYSKNIFNEFQIFKKIYRLTISRTIIHTCTINSLGEFSNLKVLSFYTGEILSSDSISLAASLPKNLEILIMFGIDNAHANWIINGLNSCDNIYEIDISGIDCMDTHALNQLTVLNALNEFSLKDVVFFDCPDFSFLKKMKALKKLSMYNIFYSYTEELKVKDLNIIKQSIMYLIPENTENSVLDKYADVVNRNKEVGSCISPTDINIGSNLYYDLGLHRIEPSEEIKYNISIVFDITPCYLLLETTTVCFSLNQAHQMLDIKVGLPRNPITQELFFKTLQRIEFPFLEIKTIGTIYLENTFITQKENEVMDMLSDKIMEYERNNKIKGIGLISLLPSVTIDMYKIIMFNNTMPDLLNLKLTNISFAADSTIPEDKDEKLAMKSYKKFMEKNPNLKAYLFIKEEDNPKSNIKSRFFSKKKTNALKIIGSS